LTSIQSEIGFVDYLTTTDRWNNLKGKLLAEKDAQKQAALRRQAAIADFGIATVDAVTESGEFVMVDASGTRVVLALAPEKTVLVVGGQKLVKDMDTAWERVKTYSYVTESARMRAFYNGQVPGSTISNSYVSSTAPFQKGHFHLILIEEQVGY
jgi:L-lactate utilization protein LutB